VTHSHAAADGVVDANDRVSMLMDAARDLRTRAVGEVLALRVLLAAPLAVPLAVEAVIEAGAEVEPGVGDRRDRHGPLGAVVRREVKHATEHAPVVVAN